MRKLLRYIIGPSSQNSEVDAQKERRSILLTHSIDPVSSKNYYIIMFNITYKPIVILVIVLVHVLYI